MEKLEDYQQSNYLHQFDKPTHSIKQKYAVTRSHHFQKYMQSMMQWHKAAIKHLKLVKQHIKEQGISINDQFSPKEFNDITLKIISQSINKEVVILKAEWGVFSTEIRILNIRGTNVKHKNSFQAGRFGCIYKGIFRQKVIIIKCISLQIQSSRRKVIEEWFILKIASSAGFGPNLFANFGFDILMFEDCAQFAMEACQQITSNNFSQDGELYQSLALMHSLHIIHNDIKPENMMFSRVYSKIVFIDFGLSNIISQEIMQRSLTQFKGTLNYCSPEMKMCFVEDKCMFVDLYYNDLYCLQKSMKDILSLLSKNLAECQEDQDKHNCSVLQMKYFESYYLYLLKYQLYHLQIQEYFECWHNQINFDAKRGFIPEILQFLLELIPCEKLTQFFFKIVDDSFIQSAIYSQLKLIYETVQQRLCCIEFLRDNQKQTMLMKYCEAYEDDNNTKIYSSSQSNRILSLGQIMIKQQEIKRINFEKYVGLYLEYMSYMNNKCKITWIERQKAATVYYSMFISPIIHSKLKNRALVKKTIEHIFKWLINASESIIDGDLFAHYTFRMFDFIIILCSESGEEFIGYVRSIYYHKSLKQVYKILFWLRVSQCGFFIGYRLFAKAKESRREVLMSLFSWTAAEKSILLSFKQIFQVIISEYNPKKKEVRFIQSKQFMKEFGSQIIEQCLIHQLLFKQQKQSVICRKFIQLFNQLNASSKNLRIFHFLLQFYDYCLANDQYLSLCKKVINIIKINFGDPTLLQQFVFSFQLDLVFPIKYSEHWDLKPGIMHKLNSQLMKIKEKDLILLSYQLLGDISKIYSKNVIQQKFLFFQSYKLSLITFFEEQLFSEIGHQLSGHINFIQLDNFTNYFMSMNIVPTIDDLKELICSESKFLKIQCSECKQEMMIYFKILNLRRWIEKYNLSMQLPSFRLKDQNSCLETYLAELKKFKIQIVNSNMPIKKLLNLREIVLRLNLQLSKANSFLERKCHGVQEYFQFALQKNSFQIYFRTHYCLLDQILSTILFLYHNNRQNLIIFLVKLVQIIEKTLNKSNYLTLAYYFSIFLKQSPLRAHQLFIILQKYERSSAQTAFIAILYGILLKFSHSLKMQNKIAAATFRIIHKVHIHFQREISILFFQKVVRNMRMSKEDSSKRKWLYCNNKWLKLLMIQGRTKPVISVIQDKRDQKACLRLKIRRMENISSKDLSLKFLAKQKLK